MIVQGCDCNYFAVSFGAHKHECLVLMYVCIFHPKQKEVLTDCANYDTSDICDCFFRDRDSILITLSTW